MKKYKESLFYQINHSSKCFNMLFDHLFKNLDVGITAIEYLALSVIIDYDNCCQRDLAKNILKDRANTGKLANSLQKKGLITIELKQKNNKPVKILNATKKGIELNNKIAEIMRPIDEKINAEFSSELVNETIEVLKNFREAVQKIVKVNI